MTKSAPTPIVVLSIAGSDCSGGAGIAADLKTFAAHGLFGTYALTAVTAQNTTGVTESFPLSPELVAGQIDAVLSDFSVPVAKTGMLATSEIIEMLIERASNEHLPCLVVDPVMVASSGAVLLEPDAISSYRRLLAYAQAVTPNLAETETLLDRPVTNLVQMRNAAVALCDLGVRTAVVKGGHLKGADAIDVVCDQGELYELAAPMIHSHNTHGTGCTLSAAIASGLAMGLENMVAIERAKDYVHRAIAASSTWQLGKGHGPLEHFPRD